MLYFKNEKQAIFPYQYLILFRQANAAKIFIGAYAYKEQFTVVMFTNTKQINVLQSTEKIGARIYETGG